MMCSGVFTVTGRADGAGRFRVISLTPTQLFPRSEPLRQLARLKLEHNDSRALSVRICVSMECLPARDVHIDNMPTGESTHDIEVPDISKPTGLRLEFYVNGASQPTEVYETIWQPQRHWVVYVMRSSHTDIGYENYVHVKRPQLAEYVDHASRITDATWSEPDASRYRWTIEHLYWLSWYLGERTWQRSREIVDDYIKTGKMGLPGCQAGVHSHWHSYELLCRSTYWGRRNFRDWLGLDSKLYITFDNPTTAWPMAQAWAKAGGRYILDARQGWRTGGKDAWHHTRVPRMFWWVGPNGYSKVLFYHMTGNYGEFRHILSSGYEGLLEQLPAFLKRFEDGNYGEYPYDILLTAAYMDHVPPIDEEAQYVIEWNKRWRYPELRIDDPEKFLRLAEERYGPQIPVLSGDTNNWSADYAAIHPDAQGQKRMASYRMATAESLTSIARIFDPQFPLAQRRADDAYWNMSEFDEHTWPTGPEPNDFQESNTWRKINCAKVASDIADEELDRGLKFIAQQIEVKKVPIIMVFNPLAHSVTEIVSVSAEGSLDGVISLVDTSTGHVEPCQSDNGQLVFLARDLPAFGYKTYYASKTEKPNIEGKLDVGDTWLENDFYRVELDPKIGVIKSIYDKKLDRELVDQSADHKFNQFIYQYVIGPTSPEGWTKSPQNAEISISADGLVLATIQVETTEPKSGAKIHQYVTLHRNMRRIDIKNELREVKAMWGDERAFASRQYGHVGPRYKHNIFFAFPFDVPDATIRAEYAGGIVRPYDDQLRLGSHDYLSVQQYVDCNNDDFGVIWTTRETPIIHIGGIRYNYFSNTYKPEKPWLYSYAMSNRLAGILWHHPKECNATLNYSLTSYKGSWSESGAAQYGWQNGNPPVAVLITQPQSGSLPSDCFSFIELDKPNIQMTVLKPSEQPGKGFVMRFVETEGREQTDAHVRLPFTQLAKVNSCNIVEDDGEVLEIDDDRRGFNFSIKKFDYVTVRVIPVHDSIPDKVQSVSAKAISDKAVRLSWQKVPGATSYNIYRLPAKGEAVCLYNLAGETALLEYVDDWLNLDTEYYYRVAAVGEGNLQGEASEEVSIRTKAENASPPSTIRELMVIERRWDKVILIWRTNPEPDVVRYEIYRSQERNFPIDEAYFIGSVDKPEPLARQLYFDEAVVPGQSYYYRLVAVDKDGYKSDGTAVMGVNLPPEPERAEAEEILPGVITEQFASKALNRNIPYTLLLPKQEMSDGSRLPLLLVLHSDTRNHLSLLSQGDVPGILMNIPFAIAFADGGSSWWIDSPVSERSKYQTMLIELLNHLEEKYKVGGSVAKRAVTGWSMGGYGAFMLAADYPDKFGAVSSMIGGLDFPFQDLHTAPSNSIFGPRGNAWDRLSPTRRVKDLENTDIGIFGSSDGQDMPHNAVIHSALENAGTLHTYEIIKGRHDIATTLLMLPKVLAFHAKIWGM